MEKREKTPWMACLWQWTPTQRLLKIKESVVLVVKAPLEQALPSALVLTKLALLQYLLEAHRLPKWVSPSLLLRKPQSNLRRLPLCLQTMVRRRWKEKKVRKRKEKRLEERTQVWHPPLISLKQQQEEEVVKVVGEEEQSPPDDGGALASTLNKLKMMMEKEEGYSGQEPQYYHYVPPAHCRVKPHFQFLLFMKASDQCDSKEEEEDGAKDERQQQVMTESKNISNQQLHIWKRHWEWTTTGTKHTNPTSATVRTEEESGSTPAGQGDTAVVDSSSQQTDTKQVMSEPTDTGPRMPTGPFFPVLSKDESTTLQWPSELLEFTKAQPSPPTVVILFTLTSNCQEKRKLGKQKQQTCQAS